MKVRVIIGGSWRGREKEVKGETLGPLALPNPKATIKMCDACVKQRVKGWTCRNCGARCCAHYCSLKVGDTACCGGCYVKSGIKPRKVDNPK